MTPKEAKEIGQALSDPKLKIFADEILALFNYECALLAKLIDKPEPLTDIEVRAIDFHKARRSCFASVLGIKRTLEQDLKDFLDSTSPDADGVKETAE